MKDHHKDKAHPHHKGGGMPYFEKDHWQKPVEDVMTADTKYASEFGAPAEYKKSVDELSSYVKKHREAH
jgi:hypothetical protein